MHINSNPFRRRAGRLVATASLAVLLGACASSTRLEPAAPVQDLGVGARAPSASTQQGASGSTGVASQSHVATLDLGKTADDGAGNGKLSRVIYFDYDSYVVKEDYRRVVESNASYLNADRKRRMLVEGHTDERGGREYNLALGQKRADAVVRALLLLGVAEAQAEAVSYGEERPAAPGTEESAWAKNRRVELKDR